jgi:hypothetical protein
LRATVPTRVIPVDHPEIMLGPSVPVPIQKQLHDRLREAVVAGQLPRGELVLGFVGVNEAGIRSAGRDLAVALDSL